jgi:hypothetical protein
MLLRNTHRAAPRRGVILLVVLAMLTLFAIVGLTFVLFSDSTAISSKINKDAENQIRPDMDPELAMSLFLGQLIYDCHDDEMGVQSSLRGHSLARTMYGANFSVITQPGGHPVLDANGRPSYHTVDSTGTKTILGNCLPYCGVGRYQLPSTLFPGFNEWVLANYQYFAVDGFVRDPEYTQTRSSPSARRAGSYIASNASYTYWDPNTMFLACFDSPTGEIRVPSFRREWMFGSELDAYPGNPYGLFPNPNWTNRVGKYIIVRPRPVDHLLQSDVQNDPVLGRLGWPLPLDAIARNAGQTAALNSLIATLQAQGKLLPYPRDRGADVKNADWAAGGCDSMWIDIGAPVLTMADGRKYKMLVAPLILDLDNRLNLNVAGNILGTNRAHASNQGWGPWEMNPAKVLNATIAPNEWQNLFVGSSFGTTTNNYGRYGPDNLPPGRALSGGTFLHDYARIDFNGVKDPGQAGAGSPTDKYLLPGFTGNPNNLWHSFPYYPPTGYGNGVPVETTDPITGKQNHPAAYNPLRASSAASDDRRLSVQSMHALLRGGGFSEGGTGSEFVTSDLRILMNNLSFDQAKDAAGNLLAVKRRNQVTTISTDLDRPSVIPYIWNPNDTDLTRRFRMQAATATRPAQPTGGPAFGLAFPSLAQRNATPNPGEFDANTWRSLYATLGRVDLNRPLRKYPPLTPNDGTTGVFNLADPTTQAQYQAAVLDRQQLAQDIFDVLRKVTGAVDIWTVPALRATYPVTSPEYQALRWLAQLAVNIVDYIDEDDYMTPFHWDTGNVTPGDMGWVFGVELPRLTLNEAYAQLDNDNSDTQLRAAANPQATLPYRMNVWVELHNPLPAETFPGQHLHANPNAQLQLTMNGRAVPVYQVLLTQPGLNIATGPLSDPANVTGDPDFGNAGPSRVNGTVGGATPNPWGTLPFQQTVLPANGAYSGPSLAPNSNQGFYVLGPEPPPGPNGAFFDTLFDPNFPTTLKSPQMSYPVPLTAAPAAAAIMPSLDVVLQRLACPHMPPNPLPGKPGNNPNLPPNPHITTDALELTGTADHNTTMVWDSRSLAGTGVLRNAPGVVARATRQTVGRLQPYAAGLPLQRQIPLPVPANQAQNTFFRHNAREDTPPTAAQLAAATETLKTSFDWLTHLDRVLVSPMELINVSGVKPHELTRWFQSAPAGFNARTLSTNPSPHLVPWTKGDGRLYRFFEFATTGSFQDGYAVGGRVPGKINVNTMGPQDLEVFRAIVDAQPGNTFYSTSGSGSTVADRLFNLVINDRTPFGIPTSGDNPFLSLGTGHAPGFDLASGTSRSLDNTLLRAQIGGAGLVDPQRMLEPTYPSLATPNGPYPRGTLQPAMYHPYQRYELLNKIMKNLTVRSNVFAVFMTVGFFEVRDDSSIPVKLGAEIGRSENRHVRHRAFAIVDRTHLQMASTHLKPPVPVLPGQPGGIPGVTIVVPPGEISTALSFVIKEINDPNTGILEATAGINTASNLHWTIEAGTMLTVNPNTNGEETVTVFQNGTLPTGQPRLQARFFKNHGSATNATNAAVVVRGNPGPRFRYNPRGDTNVVPYFAIIE